ncbi:MAG: bifunctional oligoribonuclease/PAP phosphatase NrnA [Flavobacteriaceae bacterium]|jgi:phosphoesterase RecJ-like protein|nr:bifunctional oligoribonuclease/PAP phosphatase NrnA [Flavobacteriaceae bacterium]
MYKEFTAQLKELLSTPQDCVIFPHKNPDGDALGSTLALWHFLKKEGHNCHVVSPNEYPKFLEWLPGQEQIHCFSKTPEACEKLITEATVFFTLDFNALGRIGPMDKLLGKTTTPIVMIDHHEAPQSYATLKYSDPSIGSTCEMVFNVLASWDKSLLDKSIATCLYTGMMTDSGSFRFSSTTATTHKIVAQLLELGVDHTIIHQNIYDSYRFERLQLLGITLNNLSRVDQLAAVYTTLSQEELNSCDYQKGDTEGFVNYGLSLEGIKLAVIMIENKQEGIIKMSFRSKAGFDVNTFARKYFNGGGHFNAAGGMSTDSLENTRAKLEKAILAKAALLQ